MTIPIQRADNVTVATNAEIALNVFIFGIIFGKENWFAPQNPVPVVIPDTG